MLERSVPLEMLGQGDQHVAGARGERLPLAPVGTQLVQMLGQHPADRRGVLLVQSKAVGVMPLPALMNRIFSGSGSGRTRARLAGTFGRC